jgi:hypothetical protein
MKEDPVVEGTELTDEEHSLRVPIEGARDEDSKVGKIVQLTVFSICCIETMDSSRALLAACFILVSCMAYFFTLKMEVTCCCETSVDF